VYMSAAPILQNFNKEHVIAISTVVVFVAAVKMYNVFLAAPMESYSDVDIAKFAIIGTFAVFGTKAAITALFERSIDVGAAVGVPETAQIAAPQQPQIPSLTRLVR